MCFVEVFGETQSCKIRLILFPSSKILLEPSSIFQKRNHKSIMKTQEAILHCCMDNGMPNFPQSLKPLQQVIATDDINPTSWIKTHFYFEEFFYVPNSGFSWNSDKLISNGLKCPVPSLAQMKFSNKDLYQVQVKSKHSKTFLALPLLEGTGCGIAGLGTSRPLSL